MPCGEHMGCADLMGCDRPHHVAVAAAAIPGGCGESMHMLMGMSLHPVFGAPAWSLGRQQPVDAMAPSEASDLEGDHSPPPPWLREAVGRSAATPLPPAEDKPLEPAGTEDHQDRLCPWRSWGEAALEDDGGGKRLWSRCHAAAPARTRLRPLGAEPARLASPCRTSGVEGARAWALEWRSDLREPPGWPEDPIDHQRCTSTARDAQGPLGAFRVRLRLC